MIDISKLPNLNIKIVKDALNKEMRIIYPDTLTRTIVHILIILMSVFLQNIYVLSQEKLDYDIVLENTRIDDVVVDKQNHIIVLDHNQGKIRVYDIRGVLLRVISLPEEKSSQFHAEYSSRKLSVDEDGNIYCLTLSFEYYISITKYDTSGRLIKRFDNNSTMPSKNERIIDFYVSSTNKIYINTFTHGKTRADVDPVYVYDSDGKLLGKLDYYIEDLHGNVYRLDTSQKVGIVLGKYQQTKVRPSKELFKLSENKIEGNVFAGIDGANNIYFVGEENIVKYNAVVQEIQTFPARLKDLETKGIYTNPRNIRVGYDGTIYLFGLRRGLSKDKEGCDSKVSSILIRLKDR